ncbi:gamma-glutamylcyclotransferase [Methylacidiphilum caldifontis]|uniref:gamma-glutamylcyclotransferase family protein n=1 Tax=Methylacidiphilum caldifontis TaxID=2795386 RepID=UPI001A8DD7FC|nr:gamma-glutamylcyclotransferase family protein [Methylacidiphilum caldifontis]QSR87929.1 gamma-glutamylcyclotransferase [Methylacidiphilum caldifontis]
MDSCHLTGQNLLGRLNLFVYGTLKRGFSGHEQFCKGALSIKKAAVYGRLYEHRSGFPVLYVPETSILAEGTEDYLSDLAKQKNLLSKGSVWFGLHESNLLKNNWQIIQGELLTFNDPQSRLRLIDDYEGFWPASHCLFKRVLVPVNVEKISLAAWLYIGGSICRDNLVWLKEGCWPTQRRS